MSGLHFRGRYPRLWLRQGYLPPSEAKFIAGTDYFWHAAK